MESTKRINQMIISKFKAQCISILKQIKTKKEPLVVTLRGEPLVTIYPISISRLGEDSEETEKRLGGQKGFMKIYQDIVSFDSTEDWEALKD